MAYLVLVRHGISEWNKLGLWTGWTDVDLNQEGEIEARRAGEAIRDIHFDKAYTSTLIRAKHTLSIVLKALNQESIPIIENPALKERDYGIYDGKNKWAFEKQVGEEIFEQIHRSWDYPIPNGETMKDVYHRVIPYYQQEILPELKKGENILVSAHGNSLRALVKYLENLSEEQLLNLEFGIGEAWVYQISNTGEIISKEIRAENPNKGKV